MWYRIHGFVEVKLKRDPTGIEKYVLYLIFSGCVASLTVG